MGGKYWTWYIKSVRKLYGVIYNNCILPYFTIFIIRSFWSWFNNELIQAAGRSEGRWSIWSSINDTSGLIIIDNPFNITDVRRYVKLLPEAVYETNNVDLFYKIFFIV